MYIRIQHNQLRFRISQHEAQQLLQNNSLADQLILAPGLPLMYQIVPNDSQSEFHCETSQYSLKLHINRKDLLNEINGRPSKQGISIPLKKEFKDNDYLVFLEIDVKKIKK